ncbi:DoxX family protein [Actinomadura craniellae]|uniref:DoxX family protein n=1 Tax=Actinomadura craniellae TaxID=2231787 RepID=UPI001F198742|nr:DoxX family protein [Actinomadura craniellae]
MEEHRSASHHRHQPSHTGQVDLARHGARDRDQDEHGAFSIASLPPGRSRSLDGDVVEPVAGLVLFFIGAVVVHLRARVFYNLAFPCAYLALAVATLALSTTGG